MSQSDTTWVTQIFQLLSKATDSMSMTRFHTLRIWSHHKKNLPDGD